ncbi:MAG TPA: RodZ domain-containing protein [Bryobacteraceae bacterium]|nr:RodZ domain-containing protein [Bryobacteraceae bacterium]
MKSVGEVIKRARQDQGLDVTSVAALTKINSKYLEAIEADDRESLPSGFFYRSFVHQYATTLGMDTREIDGEVERLLSADAPLPLPGQANEVTKSLPPVTVVRRFQTSRAITSFAALALVMAACSGVYAWWHKSQTAGNIAEQGRPVLAAPAPQATAFRTASTSSPQPSTSSAQQGLESVPGYKVLLDLIAKEETWLSIYSDGKKVFSGTLAPNQTKSVEGRESAKVTMGNAAGLEVHLNGRVLEPLGNRGQVLTVLFTPDKFQIFQQPPKPADPQPKAGEVGGEF